MRGFVVVCWLLAGCHATTVQAEETRAECQIICDCGLLSSMQGVTAANCVDQCVMQVGAQPLPDTCVACIYEYEHECGALVLQCAPECR